MPYVGSKSAGGKLSKAGPNANTTAPISPPVQPLPSEKKKKKMKDSAKGLWVRTSPSMLEAAEKRMLKTIVDRLHQLQVVGINTISSVPHVAVSKSTIAEVVNKNAMSQGVNSTPEASRRFTDTRKHVVLLHGLAGGLTNFVPNWEALVNAGGDNTVVHALDLPGFARSTRKDPTTGKSPKFTDANSVMNWYSKCLLQWFSEMGLVDTTTTPPTPKAQIVLAGHSFGGYLSACFSIRNPTVVHHLVLIEAWGFNPKNHDPDVQKTYGWKANALLFAMRNVDGPLAILRWAGPCGTSLLPRFRPDFHQRWETLIGDGSAFNDYTYHCNVVTPPTGERAFQACCGGISADAAEVDQLPANLHKLHAIIGAEAPLVDLLPANLDKLQDLKISVIYGEETWMDTSMGMRLVRESMAHRRTPNNKHHYKQPTWKAASAEMESQLDGYPKDVPNGSDGYGVSMDYIPRAGHQVMADNPVALNEVLINRIFKWSPATK